MTWGQYLFSFHGRLNRARYWAFVGVVIAIATVAIVVALVAISSARVPPRVLSASTVQHNPTAVIILGTIGLAFYLAFLVANLAVTTKRLHDRAKSAWWLLIFFVLPGVLNYYAVANARAPSGRETADLLLVVSFAITIWGFVEIACLRGTNGPNRFGPDPLSYTPDVAAATFN